ncbi:hypothetical protein BH23BAC1_BH23BAC1_50260 [soil metagenome]|jgi:hypothetical protein
MATCIGMKEIMLGKKGFYKKIPDFATMEKNKA